MIPFLKTHNNSLLKLGSKKGKNIPPLLGLLYCISSAINSHIPFYLEVVSNF